DETPGDERHEAERGGEVGVREARTTSTGQYFRKRLVLADEGVDGRPNPAIGNTGDQDADTPPEQDAPLQADGQYKGVPEAPRSCGPSWPGGHEPCAEVAPGGQRAGRGDQDY